ncbi:MAG: tRNA dihydrouridine(20/20a) synthase DusA [Rickettsiales bacterium TMED289]|nr:tRNA dihydrouridine(20/20a) synthase DusA [Gammaproteobacteria bacterium]MAJ89963.1 tRNA dihydrouridine(20/20a) synthase DusA [Flavobacteriales bacterium]RPF74473.1 MAG: tRNA dihydrouridine(20/20a) synthase DusA [Rickettsiales bacterium TMED289]
MRLNDHKFCIAPMMKKTDRHFRFLARQFTKKSMLYTEMIHSNAILKGDKEKLLSFSGIEHPVGLQLGGSDPEALAEAANIGETFGYDEINLNVGCPSKKVKSGNFGVFLMKDTELLCSCIKAMKKNTTIPLTIKCRIGVDQFEGEDYLKSFIEKIAEAGISLFIIHARKAISGLDTKRNRSIPPLDYDLVYKIKNAFPELKIIVNGGIEDMENVKMLLERFDGVMLGRKIYSDPTFLLNIDKEIYSQNTNLEFNAGIRAFMTYILNLSNPKDVNRSLNHLLQIIRRVSHTKDIRRKLLSGLNNENMALEDVFIDFQEDLLQKVQIQNL